MRAPFLLLLFAELAGFGIWSHRLGFYHDDWVFLENCVRGGSFWGAVGDFAEGGYWTRPLEILHFPLLYALGGLKPFPYHAVLLALDLAQAALFFTLLKRLLDAPRLALLAAILFILHPSRFATHVWMASSPQALALTLVLGSLVLFLKWMDSRSLRWLILSQALYLAGFLSYESGAFLPLFLFGGLAGRYLNAGLGWKRSLRDAAAALIPFGLSLAAGLAWQIFGAAALQGANPKSLSPSLVRGLKVFGAGFECLANRALHVCWKLAPGAWLEASWGLRLAWAACTAVIAGWLGRRPAAEGEDRAVRPAFAAAGAGFFAAYLPYAVSADYSPQVFGLMSRTNAAGALAGALALAAGLAAFADKVRPQRTALLVLVGAFTWANWGQARHWARSWEIQTDLLARLAPKADRLPKGSMIFVCAPRETGTAPVFDAHFSVSGALRLSSGRLDLSGEPACSVPPGRTGSVYRYPEDRLETGPSR